MIDYEVMKGEKPCYDRAWMTIDGAVVVGIYGFDVFTLYPERITSEYYMRKVNTFLKDNHIYSRVQSSTEGLRLKMLDNYSADEAYVTYKYLDNARIYEVNEFDNDMQSIKSDHTDQRWESWGDTGYFA